MLTRRDSYKQTDAKFALLGARNVGKSAIAVRFLTKRFIGEYDSTQDSTYQFNSTIDDDQVNLEVLDPGPESVSEPSIGSRALWADGLLLVYSITDRKSFKVVQDLLQFIDPFKQKTVIIVIGNKSDLEHERQVSEGEGASLAEKLKCSFFECSASEGYQKVAEAFHELYREVIKRKKERRISLSPRPLRNAIGKILRRNSSKNLLLNPGTLST
ncbi:hypothetical protein OS493_035717 [Desmophyllum pertusum]|uniref:small monomeric GTPase n=1 Tax=Desmophyllum pertusum TaxID=174260 RepID=A0A9W9YIE5_9CNID|nr:hypothetical protein OS493_035717 [Desmophyllum pertusum]